MLGKFKKSLKEQCPECESILEVRTRFEESLIKGVDVEKPIDYICCSNPSCYYERETKRRKKRY